jgi:UDP:flavonoid glycosyltransferase YjiC (YdhE family)
MHQCDAAPFQNLFPRCDAVVHHGGIGTLASAVVCGTPQLILPRAHDQPDNAARVRRLGIGDRLAPNAGGRRIAGALAALSRDDVRARCAALAAQPRTCDGIDNAVARVEALAAVGRGPSLTP